MPFQLPELFENPPSPNNVVIPRTTQPPIHCVTQVEQLSKLLLIFFLLHLHSQHIRLLRAAAAEASCRTSLDKPERCPLHTAYFTLTFLPHTHTLNMASNEDENHLSRTDYDDHLESSSVTPSGAATPRPDPSDKRLPGIMHGYFGQVGKPFTTSPGGSDRCAPTTPASEQSITVHTPEHHRTEEDASTALPTAPSSPQQEAQSGVDLPVQVVLPENEGVPRVESSTLMPQITAYPTPPVSSPSSIHKERDEGEIAGSEMSSMEGGTAGCPSHGRQLSASGLFPLRTRRQTAGLQSLSAIMTDSSVHAAHISNPTSAYSSTTPSSPTRDSPPKSALSSMASSYLELAKLTENVTLSSHQKNTPPLTPRALSTEGAEITKSPPPTSNPTQSPPNDAVFSSQRPSPTAHTGSTTVIDTTDQLPTGPPKGKLLVRISEARGLRPSYDPYVVCVFEWNEYISKGPKQEESDTEKEGPKIKDEGLRAVPIKRTGNDMARAMAIPMKSRQSSTTSLSDQKKFKPGRQVTDPKWEHEAIL